MQLHWDQKVNNTAVILQVLPYHPTHYLDREDILYGSFRAWMKTTAVSGTVGAFFMYENNSEIDMETLSAVSPPQTYFAIHPGLTDPQSGRASALTHTNFYLNYNPSQVTKLGLGTSFHMRRDC
jgi:beta-glucanase (GH16 family)